MYRGALVGVFLVACSSPSSPADAPPPACAPFDITVQPVSWIGKPIWTGSEYLVVTQRSPGVIQRIGADGTIGPTFSIAADVPDTSWPIAWTGSELGVVYPEASSSGYALKLARYSPAGTQIATSIVADGLPGALAYQTLRWAGDRYVLAWIGAGSQQQHTVNIEEVSADGVVGTHAMGSVTGDALFTLATSPTTHIAIATNHLGGDPGTYVIVDRATGAESQHAVSIGLGSTSLLVRGNDFIALNDNIYLPGGTRGAAFQTIDASGMETTSVPAPVLPVPDMIVVGDRYHLVNWSDDASGRNIKDVDAGFDGTQLGPINVRATFAPTGSFAGVYAASRGNGLITLWAAGPNNAMTARLIQDCDP